MFDRSAKFYYFGNPKAIVTVKQLRNLHANAAKRGEDFSLNYLKTKLFVKELTRLEP